MWTSSDFGNDKSSNQSFSFSIHIWTKKNYFLVLFFCFIDGHEKHLISVILTVDKPSLFRFIWFCYVLTNNFESLNYDIEISQKIFISAYWLASHDFFFLFNPFKCIDDVFITFFVLFYFFFSFLSGFVEHTHSSSNFNFFQYLLSYVFRFYIRFQTIAKNIFLLVFFLFPYIYIPINIIIIIIYSNLFFLFHFYVFTSFPIWIWPINIRYEFLFVFGVLCFIVLSW